MPEQIGINDLRLFPEYTREFYQAVCGAPGKWVKDDVGSLAWESLPQPQPVAGNSVPVPVRTLAEDEEFASTPFGWVVRKKEVAPNPTPAGDTGEILRLVTAIAKTLGIQ